MGKAQMGGYAESSLMFSEQSLETEKPRDIEKLYFEYYLCTLIIYIVLLLLKTVLEIQGT